jgi:ABC transporter with metal-binding/Fe-S-binding domain ATP-binding protein
MKLAVLFSGGKDSCYAMHKAMQKNHEIACLISVLSENVESYMFHTPNIGLTKLQAQAIGIPLIEKKTNGVKEEELSDLKDAIRQAKEEYGIEGIVTGAVRSKYQSERIKNICEGLGLSCMNPLWRMDERMLLEGLVEEGYSVMITGVFAYPLDRKWLGRMMDAKTIDELCALQKKYGISPVGEGGEIETLVLDAPFFKKALKVIDSKVVWLGDSGRLEVTKAVLEKV